MALFTESVSIPLWILIIMIGIIVFPLVQLLMLLYRYVQGDIVKEEHSDMVVWRVKSRKRPATPKKKSEDIAREKEREKKTDLALVLKVLLKEGDKGVLMQTIADQMGTSTTNAQHAMQKLIDNKLVDEVVGVSGTKFYLTQAGKEYCRRKAK